MEQTTSNPTLQIEFTPTLDELVETNMIPFRRQRVRNLVWGAIGGAALATFGWLQQSPDGLVIAVGIGFFLLALFGPHLTRQRLRKYFSERRDHGSENRVRLSPEGFLAETSSGSTLIRWHAFDFINETPRYFLLFRGNGAAFIPKRAFDNPEEVRACADLLMHYVGRTAKENRPGFPISPASSPGTSSAPSPSES